MGFQFQVRRPLPVKEGWLVKRADGGNLLRLWCKVDWPTMKVSFSPEDDVMEAFPIDRCTFAVDRSADEVCQVHGQTWTLFGIRATNNNTLLDTQFFAEDEPVRMEWHRVLRKHSVHHSIANGFDVSKRVVGTGRYAHVFLAKDLLSDDKVALKTIKKNSLSAKEMQLLADEVRLAQGMNHENLVTSHEFIETPEDYVLVMEYIGGGDVYDLVYRKMPREPLARRFVYQILHGLAYMHKMGVCHRDIKPENLLVTGERPPNIKIADFGISVEVDTTAVDDSLLDDDTLQCSPGYGAPEILQLGPYGLPCDMWSLGATMYFMLTGRQPFRGETDESTRLLMLKGEYDMAPLVGFGEHARDLLSKLLTKDPALRIKSADALLHPWFDDMDDQDLVETPEQSVKAMSKDESYSCECFPWFGKRNRIADEPDLGLELLSQPSSEVPLTPGSLKKAHSVRLPGNTQSKKRVDTILRERKVQLDREKERESRKEDTLHRTSVEQMLNSLSVGAMRATVEDEESATLGFGSAIGSQRGALQAASSRRGSEASLGLSGSGNLQNSSSGDCSGGLSEGLSPFKHGSQQTTFKRLQPDHADT
mmetsp:Transcript_38891/g.95683  ORF Transcript_38891/g.95683 Transcript_38891/m.95683 type:complete len:592 (+) Transcript_38891:28-1803(+)